MICPFSCGFLHYTFAVRNEKKKEEECATNCAKATKLILPTSYVRLHHPSWTPKYLVKTATISQMKSTPLWCIQGWIEMMDLRGTCCRNLMSTDISIRESSEKDNMNLEQSDQNLWKVQETVGKWFTCIKQAICCPCIHCQAWSIPPLLLSSHAVT